LKDLVIAQKYARALFAEAQKEGKGGRQTSGDMCTPTLIACQQGFEEFVRVACLRGSLIQVLSHPFIALDEKKRLIRVSLGKYAIPLLDRFFLLLVEKHRLNLLLAIEQEFQAEVDRLQNVQPLNVRSAFPLAESQQKDLQGKLESYLKSKVRMDVQVDSSLIGGLAVQTQDFVLDQSLKGQLKKLQRHLTA
jgi:F-type H+-transporting ATPase subunit delta